VGETDRYVETFLQEAYELLADIEEAVLLVERDPNDSGSINRLFRDMHTIKGSGAMFGFSDLAAFTHHVETVLDKVRDNTLPVTRELIDLILASRDQIGNLLSASQGQAEVDHAMGDRIIVSLHALLQNGNDSEPTPAPQIEADACNEISASYRIRYKPSMDLFICGMDPAFLLDELRELGNCTITANTEDVPCLEEMNPENCYLSWEIMLSTDRGINAIRDVFIFVEDSSVIEIEELITEAQSTLPMPADSPATALMDSERSPMVACEHTPVKPVQPEQPTSDNQQSASKKDAVRVPSDKLDALINLVGELVITQAHLAQVADELDSSDLSMSVESMDRLTSELRDIVLSIRMMPIGTTFGRFKRLVRDMSGELNKKIELLTDGAETEMDKTVIDRLADPLVHLIRNSIDHGIEHPANRVQIGKSETGTIRLSAVHKGTNVIVSVQDDGKGLDAELIRKKGIEKGIIAPDAELSEKELFALIFAPGFSTASQVTSVSGRGVGMDVVRREIDALRGTVNISSKKGKGTAIDLSLPLTLAIIEGLLVSIGDDRFVIPLSMIEECLELTADRFAMDQSRNVIQIRNEPISVIRLREVIGISGRPSMEEAVIVNSDGNRLGIVVDHVIGDHQTVIKPIGSMYKDIECISGATILGDGKVALILDIQGLIDRAKEQERAFVNRNSRHGKSVA
jgi:two-component system chemotaxis sensor kinase CheA